MQKQSFYVFNCLGGFLTLPVCVCVRVGQGPEDPGQPAAGPGVLGQGQVVQHPGGRLELADSASGRRPARPPARPPGHVPGLLRLLRRGRLPELHETVQLVDGERRERNKK